MDPATTARREQLRHFFENEIPFNRVLGLKVEMLGDGCCQARVPARPEHVGDPRRPALHGGVISASADATGGLSVFLKARQGDRISTVDLRVDYLRPARTDVDLILESRVVRMGNRVAVADTIVHQGNFDEPVARSTAVYNVVRGERP
jgi:uncharacterized protein (TIGR00369 family)